MSVLRLAIVFSTVILFGIDAEAIDPPIRSSQLREFVSKVASTTIGQSQEIELDLGEVVCNASMHVRWTIANATLDVIDCPRVTASCGCISNVPSTLKLVPKGSSEGESETFVEFDIKFPTNGSEWRKQVVFWDALGNAKIQTFLKAKLVSPVVFESSIIQLKREEPVTLEIPIQAANKDIKLGDYKIAYSAPEIVETKVILHDDHSGVVQIKLNPALTPKDSVVTASYIEVSRDSLVECTLPLDIRYQHRTTTLPKQAQFQKIGDREECKLIVLSSHLVQELESGRSLEIIAMNGSKMPDAKVIVQRTDPKGCQVVVSLSSESKRPAPEKFQLTCGEWKTTVSTASSR